MKNLNLLVASLFFACVAFGQSTAECEKFPRFVVAQKISGRINCDNLHDMGYKIGPDLGAVCVNGALPEQLKDFNMNVLEETYLISPLNSLLTSKAKIVQVPYSSETMGFISPNGSLLSFSRRYILLLRKNSAGDIYIDECEAVDLSNVDLSANESLEELYSDALRRKKSFCENPVVRN